MANKQYLIELAVKDDKLKSSLKKALESPDVQKTLGILGENITKYLENDVGKAASILGKVDWASLLGEKDFEHLQQLVAKTVSANKDMIKSFIKTGDIQGIKDTIDLISDLGMQLRAIDPEFTVKGLANAIGSLMRVVDPVSGKFKELAGAPAMISASFGDMGNDISKQLERVQNRANKVLDSIYDDVLEPLQNQLKAQGESMIKLQLDDKEVAAYIEQFKDADAIVAELNKKIESSQAALRKVKDKDKRDMLSLTTLVKNEQMMTALMTKLETIKPSIDAGTVAKDVDATIEQISEKLEKGLTKTLKESFNKTIEEKLGTIRVKVDVPTEEKLMTDINAVINKVNEKGTNNLKIVGVESAINAAQDKILENTKTWHDRMKEYLKFDKKKDITLDLGAKLREMGSNVGDDFKRSIEEYFDDPNNRVSVPVELVLTDKNKAVLDGGSGVTIVGGNVNGGGSTNITTESLVKALTTPIEQRKEEAVKAVENKGKSVFFGPDDNLSKQIVDVFQELIKAASRDGTNAKKIGDFFANKGIYLTTKNVWKNDPMLKDGVKPEDLALEGKGPMDILDAYSTLIEHGDEAILARAIKLAESIKNKATEGFRDLLAQTVFKLDLPQIEVSEDDKRQAALGVLKNNYIPQELNRTRLYNLRNIDDENYKIPKAEQFTSLIRDLPLFFGEKGELFVEPLKALLKLHDSIKDVDDPTEIERFKQGVQEFINQTDDPYRDIETYLRKYHFGIFNKGHNENNLQPDKNIKGGRGTGASIQSILENIEYVQLYDEPSGHVLISRNRQDATDSAGYKANRDDRRSAAEAWYRSSLPPEEDILTEEVELPKFEPKEFVKAEERQINEMRELAKARATTVKLAKERQEETERIESIALTQQLEADKKERTRLKKQLTRNKNKIKDLSAEDAAKIVEQNSQLEQNISNLTNRIETNSAKQSTKKQTTLQQLEHLPDDAAIQERAELLKQRRVDLLNKISQRTQRGESTESLEKMLTKVENELYQYSDAIPGIIRENFEADLLYYKGATDEEWAKFKADTDKAKDERDTIKYAELKGQQKNVLAELADTAQRETAAQEYVKSNFKEEQIDLVALQDFDDKDKTVIKQVQSQYKEYIKTWLLKMKENVATIESGDLNENELALKYKENDSLTRNVNLLSKLYKNNFGNTLLTEKQQKTFSSLESSYGSYMGKTYPISKLTDNLNEINKELLDYEVSVKRIDEQKKIGGPLDNASLITIQLYNSEMRELIKLEQQLAIAEATGVDTISIKSDTVKQRRRLKDRISRSSNEDKRVRSAHSPQAQASKFLKETDRDYYIIQEQEKKAQRELDIAKRELDRVSSEGFNRSDDYQRRIDRIKNAEVGEYVRSEDYKRDRRAGESRVDKEFAEFLSQSLGPEAVKNLVYEFAKNNDRADIQDMLNPDEDGFMTGNTEQLVRNAFAVMAEDFRKMYTTSVGYQQKEQKLKEERDSVIDTEFAEEKTLVDEEIHQIINANREAVKQLKGATLETSPELKEAVAKKAKEVGMDGIRSYEESIVEQVKAELVDQMYKDTGEKTRAINSQYYEKTKGRRAELNKDIYTELNADADEFVYKMIQTRLKEQVGDNKDLLVSLDTKHEELMKQHVYSIVSQFREGLKFEETGIYHGINILEKFIAEAQHKVDYYDSMLTDIVGKRAVFEAERARAKQFGELGYDDVLSPEVARIRAESEAELTEEQEKQVRLTERLTELTSQNAEAKLVNEASRALEETQKRIERLKTIVSYADEVFALRQDKRKQEAADNAWTPERQKLWYIDHIEMAKKYLDGGSAGQKAYAEKMIPIWETKLADLETAMEAAKPKEEPKTVLTLITDAIIKGLAGATQGGVVNLDASLYNVATETTLQEILRLLGGNGAVEYANQIKAALEQSRPPREKREYQQSMPSGSTVSGKKKYLTKREKALTKLNTEGQQIFGEVEQEAKKYISNLKNGAKKYPQDFKFADEIDAQAKVVRDQKEGSLEYIKAQAQLTQLFLDYYNAKYPGRGKKGKPAPTTFAGQGDLKSITDLKELLLWTEQQGDAIAKLGYGNKNKQELKADASKDTSKKKKAEAPVEEEFSAESMAKIVAQATKMITEKTGKEVPKEVLDGFIATAKGDLGRDGDIKSQDAFNKENIISALSSWIENFDTGMRSKNGKMVGKAVFTSSLNKMFEPDANGEENLIEMANSYWRIMNWFERYKFKAPENVIAALDQVGGYLKGKGISFIDLIGKKVDAGNAVDVVSNKSSSEDKAIYSETIKPIILGEKGVIQFGEASVGDEVTRSSKDPYAIKIEPEIAPAAVAEEVKENVEQNPPTAEVKPEIKPDAVEKEVKKPTKRTRTATNRSSNTSQSGTDNTEASTSDNKLPYDVDPNSLIGRLLGGAGGGGTDVQLKQLQTLTLVLSELQTISKKIPTIGKGGTKNSAQMLFEEVQKMAMGSALDKKERVSYLDLVNGAMSPSLSGKAYSIPGNLLESLMSDFGPQKGYRSRVHTHADSDQSWFSTDKDLKLFAKEAKANSTDGILNADRFAQEILLTQDTITVLDTTLAKTVTDVENALKLIAEAGDQIDNNINAKLQAFGVKYRTAKFSELNAKGFVDMIGVQNYNDDSKKSGVVNREANYNVLSTYAQNDADARKSKFIETSFDGEILKGKLIDIDGQISKVVLAWDELGQKVKVVSDTSTSSLDKVVGKIQQYEAEIKKAKDEKLLSDGDDSSFVKAQETVDGILANIEKNKLTGDALTQALNDLEAARQKVADEGAKLHKMIAKNEKLRGGTAEVKSVATQGVKVREALGSGMLDIEEQDGLYKMMASEGTQVPRYLQTYIEAYNKLIEVQQQYIKDGTINDPKIQDALRVQALGVKKLGAEVMTTYKNTVRLQQASKDSSEKTFTDKLGVTHNLGGSVQMAESQVNLATMKQYAKEVLGVDLASVKLNTTTGKLTGVLRKNDYVVADMAMEYDEATQSLHLYQEKERESLGGVPGFLHGLKQKSKAIVQYIASMTSIYRVFGELRKGIQYIREIDLALTELKKVTDETDETYDKFLKTAAKTGARLGSTISAVTEATATFAKLGYSMEQASEMAEAAIVYKNVGDNIASTEDAADSIISTLKGFGMEASESMAIVDRFNEVGNRFAITSQGIGEALRLSASALNEGKNSLDESIALITAANEVVNDPSSVGTALKTLTLRLRGSKTELEEMGEDVSDMATTTSQLQAKLLALTGGKVDIMLDENTFKNSTQILREMAAAWEDMNDIQRASALELMGGKRQANTLSALIQNFDTVEKVIETSANSTGSALKENERYLDSIQGKIDQFNNAMQSMWSNTLDSDVVKGIVEIGTGLIKIVDKLGLINSLVFGLMGYLTVFKKDKLDLTSLLGIHDMQKGWTLGKEGVTGWIAKRLSNKQKEIQVLEKDIDDITKAGKAKIEQAKINLKEDIDGQLSWDFDTTSQPKASSKYLDIFENGLGQGTEKLTYDTKQLGVELDKLNHMDNSGVVDYMTSLDQLGDVGDDTKTVLAGYVSTVQDGNYTLQGAQQYVNQYNQNLKRMGKEAQIAQFKQNMLNLAISAMTMLLTALITKLINSMASAQDEFEKLSSQLASTKSELENVNSELDDTKKKIEELQNQGSLSFVEQEELDRLKAQNEELERQKSLKEAIQTQQQKGVNSATVKAANDYYKKTGKNSGKTTGEIAGQGAQYGAMVGGTIAAAGGGAAIGAAITAKLAAAGTVIAPGVGTLIGVLAGLVITGVSAAVGAGIGAGIGAAEEKVGESMDNMREQYTKLQEEYNAAQSKYASKTSDGNYKKMQKAQEKLTEYESMMANHLAEMDAYYSQIDLSVYDPTKDAEEIARLRNEMNEFYDTQDKWLIQSGTKDAKSNAITRIFGENATNKLKDVKEAFEDAAEAGNTITLEEAFGENGQADLDAFTARLREMGIYVFEVEQYFEDLIVAEKEAAEVSLYGVATDINKITEGLENLKSAFDEVLESGSVFAKTLTELNGVFGTLGDSWDNYVNTMFSGVLSTKEMQEATEALAKAFIDSKILTGEAISEYERMVYIIQLRNLGVTNAEEYVDDKIQENAYKAIAATADYDWDAIKKKYKEDAQKAKTENGETWRDWDTEMDDTARQEYVDWREEEYDFVKTINEEDVQKIVDEYGIDLQPRVSLPEDTPKDIQSELKKLSDGGSVDLLMRPKVDSATMNASGWDVEDGSYSTVNTSTFSNEDGTVAMNFTPILPNGDVLTPSELQEYAEAVIAGTREDDLGLQIGAAFTGENAINDAESAAEQIHLLHEQYLTDEISGNEYVIDLIQKKIDKEKELANAKKAQDDYQQWVDNYKEAEEIAGDFDPGDWWGTGRPNRDASFNKYRNEAGDELTKEQYDKYKAAYDKLQELKNSEEGKEWLNEDGTLKEGVEEDFAAAYEAAQKGVEDLENQIETELTADIKLKLELQDKSQLVDDIQEVYDTLKNAKKEYQEQGYLSVDTMQSLLGMDAKYLALLYDENGQLQLNEEALLRVAEARIIDMGITQQKAILEEGMRLATEGSRGALLEYIAVIESATKANGDFVESQLAAIKAQLKARTIDRTETDENGKVTTVKADLSEVEANQIYNSIKSQVDAVQYTVDLGIKGLPKGGLSSSGSSSGSDKDDAFQKAMDYWENRIGANQAKYEQIQNEIDLLESQGKKAGAEYYQEQIKLEEERRELLESQKAEAEKFLGTFKEGSDEWFRQKPVYWETNKCNPLNCWNPLRVLYTTT